MLLGDQRGFMSRDIPYSDAFSLKSILTKSCVCTRWRILRYTKYGPWTRQIKMIGQRKPRRNAPYKWFKLPWRQESLCPCVYPHPLYSFPPNKHFSYFTTFPLYGNSFLQSQRARTSSLTTALAPSGSLPDLSIWPGTRMLLPADAGQGHWRSIPLSYREAS